MAYDLTKSKDRLALAAQIKEDINEYCVKVYGSEERRSHLGASQIGKECARELWYNFRWVKTIKFDGRMHRLFNRGHKEEDRFCEWLRGAGITVQEFEPSLLYLDTVTDQYIVGKFPENDILMNVSGSSSHLSEAEKRGIEFPAKKQMKVSGVEGHFSGSMDGKAFLNKYGCSFALITEFKTSSDKYFKKMIADGVRVTKPEHYAQMCVYGYKDKVKFGLYLMINKNDDSIHVEVVELDWLFAEELERKAEFIITSQVAPPRAYDKPTDFRCRYCDYLDICWNNAEIEKNCRSCKLCNAAENKEWYCDKWNSNIPFENIKDGCKGWVAIC